MEREYFRNKSELFEEFEGSDKGKIDELDLFDNVASEWMDDYE